MLRLSMSHKTLTLLKKKKSWIKTISITYLSVEISKSCKGSPKKNVISHLVVTFNIPHGHYGDSNIPQWWQLRHSYIEGTGVAGVALLLQPVPHLHLKPNVHLPPEWSKQVIIAGFKIGRMVQSFPTVPQKPFFVSIALALQLVVLFGPL